jgi:hypothetical protein
MNMTQVILKKLNPIVVEKLKRLAQSHQRTLEEEITSILEDVTENTPIITPENRDWSPGFFEQTCGSWRASARSTGTRAVIMSYLLDTNACIRYLNSSNNPVFHRLNLLSPDDVFLCDIVKFERMKTGKLLYELIKMPNLFLRR